MDSQRFEPRKRYYFPSIYIIKNKYIINPKLKSQNSHVNIRRCLLFVLISTVYQIQCNPRIS